MGLLTSALPLGVRQLACRGLPISYTPDYPAKSSVSRYEPLLLTASIFLLHYTL